MSRGLRELQAADLAAEIERDLLPRLAGILRSRGLGHCMRVDDLDRDLMTRLCARLRAEVPAAQVFLLGDGRSRSPGDLTITSHKLVELRNPLPDGTLRPPLMVFIPGNLRVAAEDSFGVATFEGIELGDVYTTVRQRLLQEMPGALRGAIAEGLHRLESADAPWSFADPVSIVRFLLTAKINGNDPEAVGAALYELALVPDFELLADPTRAPSRIGRNRDCVSKLTWSPKSERGRILDLGLENRAFRAQLGSFLVEAGAEDPRVWTRRIIRDRDCWSLAFHRWEFADGGLEPESIFIGDVVTSLPEVPETSEDERLQPLIGQQVLVLGSGGARKLSVSFRVDPHPSGVHGLTKLVAQVISKEHGPVGLARGKGVWKSSRLKATIGFTRLNKTEWEEGWHFVRVLAQTADGDLVPLADERGEPLPWAADESDVATPRPNESDLFYVIGEVEEPPEPPQRAVPRDNSLEHARLRLQMTAVADDRDPEPIAPSFVAWVERRSRGRAAGAETLAVKFGREGTVHVPVAKPLKALEQQILASPEDALSWRVPVKLGEVGSATSEPSRWPESETAAAFLAARRAWFAAVRGEPKELVTQGVDLRRHRHLAAAYADAYQQLLQDLMERAEAGAENGGSAALADLRRALAVDTIALVLTDHRGRRRDAGLVAPTHPLRALWLAAWAAVGARWVRAAQAGPDELVVATREALLRHLAPVGFPPVLAMPSGRLMTAVDNVHALWTLYARAQEADLRGLVGDVCAALGLPEPGGAVVDGAALALRVRRYLLQHPYVRTLLINAFNPGRAGVLAELLLHLQKEPALADLRYDVRLFVPDADAPGVGEALADLLSPTTSLTGREADAFATPTDSHLHPKLSLAVKPTAEFRQDSARHAAHLTLLFDLFQAEEVGAVQATVRDGSAPVHGLVQDFQVDYHEDESTVAWRRQPRHGTALPLAGAEEISDLLSSLPELLSAATATVATGETGMSLRPVVTLALDANERSLLHQVHEASDWVFILDRNMGIEFFDHGGLVERPDYLIDHSPTASLGHQLIITSRSVAELEAILGPVLDQYNLKAEGRHAVAILDQLRSLSGRLALKLISAPTQRAEALGLALSRMYLDHQGVFSNQIVVPLDVHLELYRSLKKQADELGGEVSFKRTDLALFDLDAAARVITCRLVEVKCYAAVGDLGAYNQLKDHITEQIRQSEEVLSTHFDPHRSPTDRADRLVKTRELVALLEFYLDRGIRYGVMAAEAADEARYLLRSLEDGYRLAFTRSALIFDFEKPGTGPPEVEGGIEFHRVGVDLIQQLVEASAPTAEECAATERALGPEATPAARSEAARRRRREKAPSVRALETAAFLSAPRDRSISWEDLASRRSQDLASRVVDPQVATEPRPAQPLPSSRPGRDEAVQDSLAEARPVNTGSNRTEKVEAAKPEPSLPAPAPVADDSLKYDVLLGVTKESPQYGLLGEVAGRRIALDLNDTHTLSLFGVQGGGKSYTLGTIVEMASLPIPEVNRLPQPLATVIFHYSPTMDYEPEFTSMVAPNSEASQVAALRERYGAEPRSLNDVVLLVPEDQLEKRQGEYPGIEVHPLKFASTELEATHWRLLMNAIGNRATYIRQLTRIMKQLRRKSALTLESLRSAVEDSTLPDQLRKLAVGRLELAAEYIDDSRELSKLVRPGRLLIIDLRDEFIEQDEAFGLFFVMLQLIAKVGLPGGGKFNKLFVFDEAHKYMTSGELVGELIRFVREMRHVGFSVLVASQDPISVPVRLIELSSILVMHQMSSPAWLKHIQKANAALGELTPTKMAHLRPGEAYVWSRKATDEAFRRSAVKVKCRPRVTQHGGSTKQAV